MDLMVSCRFAHTIWHILAIFSSVQLVTGPPTHSSSVTYSLPSENCLLHLYTTVFFMAFSPYTCMNISCISLPLLPSFTRNLVFVHCSNSISDIFMTAHTHKHKQQCTPPSTSPPRVNTNITVRHWNAKVMKSYRAAWYSAALSDKRWQIHKSNCQTHNLIKQKQDIYTNSSAKIKIKGRFSESTRILDTRLVSLG